MENRRESCFWEIFLPNLLKKSFISSMDSKTIDVMPEGRKPWCHALLTPTDQLLTSNSWFFLFYSLTAWYSFENYVSWSKWEKRKFQANIGAFPLFPLFSRDTFRRRRHFGETNLVDLCIEFVTFYSTVLRGVIVLISVISPCILNGKLFVIK